MMADVAAIAGSEGDPLKRLEDALSPIEKYAVRLIEEVGPVSALPLVCAQCRGGFLSYAALCFSPVEKCALRVIEEMRSCALPFATASKLGRKVFAVTVWHAFLYPNKEPLWPVEERSCHGLLFSSGP